MNLITAAKILGETGDIRRFRGPAAFARHNGTAPRPRLVRHYRRLWAELAAGCHAAAGRAASARAPRRHKQGRIVSGAAASVPAGQWLTPGHRRAKTVTNCVANRWGDGPDTPAGVRDRAARQHDPSPDDLLAGVDDQTIAMAIRGVRDLEERWIAVPPGGTLRLSRPLPRDLFARAAGTPRPAGDQGQPGAERPGPAPPSRRSSRTPLPRLTAAIACGAGPGWGTGPPVRRWCGTGWGRLRRRLG